MTKGKQLSLFYPTVSRYRLTLVREAEAPYGAARCSRPAVVARFLYEPVLVGACREELGALYLDTLQHVIGYSVCYLGTLNRTSVEPRGILVPALLLSAAGVILFHNHPSGDPTPSGEDLSFTRRCAQAGEIVGVSLVDHLILGSSPDFVSLRELGGGDVFWRCRMMAPLLCIKCVRSWA